MLALSIAQGAASLEGKIILPLQFTMSRDRAQQHAAHLEAVHLSLIHISTQNSKAKTHQGLLSRAGE